MNAYTIGLYEKAMPTELTWEDKLVVAKDNGYDYMELSIDQTEEKIARIDMSSKKRLELIDVMYKIGIPISSMCVSALTKYSLGNDDGKLCNRGMYILEEAIKLANDLGIRIVMIPGYDVYYQPSTNRTQERFIQNLKKATDIAAAYGVVLGLETMENSFMNTVWKAMYYINQINSVYLQIYPDSGNVKNAAVSSGGNVVTDLLLGKGHITSLHLKESKPGVYREVPYGEGHVDFEQIIQAAWSIGIRKYVTEFWYKKDDKDWQRSISDSNIKMRRILDKCVAI